MTVDAMSGKFTSLSLNIEGRVAKIEMHSPPVNALNDTLLEELEQALVAVSNSADCRVLRISSRLPSFSAGADLKMVGARVNSADGPHKMRESVTRFHAVFDRLAGMPCVTIAEIDGIALGGGFEMALACDIRCASEAAHLGLPEPAVGLIPGAGGTQRLTQICGPAVAKWIILGGAQVDGREALRLGLVHTCSAKGEIAPVVDELVDRILKSSPEALRMAKKCIGLASAISRSGADAEIDAIEHLMKTQDTKNLLGNFLSKKSA